MKKKTKSTKVEGESNDDARLQSVPSKIIRKKPTLQKQYPAKVGYHGTDEEKDLNPEE